MSVVMSENYVTYYYVLIHKLYPRHHITIMVHSIEKMCSDMFRAPMDVDNYLARDVYDPNACENGWSLLTSAIYLKKYHEMRILLENGADPNLSSEFTGHPISILDWDIPIDVLYSLVHYGADINKGISFMFTRCLENDCLTKCQSIIERGLDVHARFVHGGEMVTYFGLLMAYRGKSKITTYDRELIDMMMWEMVLKVSDFSVLLEPVPWEIFGIRFGYITTQKYVASYFMNEYYIVEKIANHDIEFLKDFMHNVHHASEVFLIIALKNVKYNTLPECPVDKTCDAYTKGIIPLIEWRRTVDILNRLVYLHQSNRLKRDKWTDIKFDLFEKFAGLPKEIRHKITCFASTHPSKISPSLYRVLMRKDYLKRAERLKMDPKVYKKWVEEDMIPQCK